MRALLMRVARREHIFVVIVPHTVTDWRSCSVFFREFTRIYAACASHRSPALPPLAIQVRDVADAQRCTDHSAPLRYWRRRFQGLSVASRCPLTQGEATPTDGAPTMHEMKSSPRSLASAMLEFSRRHSASPALLSVACVAAFLHLRSKEQHVVVGLVHANRSNPGTRDLIGCFADCVPLLVDCSGAPSLGELVRRVSVTLAEAEAHGAPWALVRDLLDDPAHLA